MKTESNPQSLPRARKILVTGGWGYGNLGDDAILLETLKLISRESPEARTTVLTYDQPGTLQALKEYGLDTDVEMAPSLHRQLVGDALWRRFGHVSLGSKSTRLSEFLRRADSRLQPRQFILARGMRNSPGVCREKQREFSRYFEDVDLLVMAGGGYMNFRVMDSLVAHSCEALLAEDGGAAVMITGQSIGPLKPRHPYYRPAAELTLRALSQSSYVSVRDTGSLRELGDYGVRAELIPDVALALDDEQVPETRGEAITFAIRSLPLSSIACLAEHLRSILRETGLSLRIVVTRLWGSDIDCAQRLHVRLRDMGTESELLVPQTLGPLQECLSSSRAVISMNLHGSIIAWRAGVPVVTVNGSEKARAFMEQTGNLHALNDLKGALTGDWLQRTLAVVIEDGVDKSCRKRIADDVSDGFNRGLRACLLSCTTGVQ